MAGRLIAVAKTAGQKDKDESCAALMRLSSASHLGEGATGGSSQEYSSRHHTNGLLPDAATAFTESPELGALYSWVHGLSAQRRAHRAVSTVLSSVESCSKHSQVRDTRFGLYRRQAPSYCLQISGRLPGLGCLWVPRSTTVCRTS